MKMSLAARFKIYNDMLNKDFSGYFMESNEHSVTTRILLHCNKF